MHPKSMTVALIAIISIFFAGAIGYKKYNDSNKLSFVVEMKASNAGISQIFFDIGNGTLEKDSSRLQIIPGTLQKYSFPLPLSIKSIRFDITNVSDTILVKSARIESSDGIIIKHFPFNEFKPEQQISKMDVNGDSLIIHTSENANDPIIIIGNSSLNFQFNWHNYMMQNLWEIIGSTILIFLLLIGLAYFVKVVARNQFFSNTILGLKKYALENPKKSIAFIGLIAAIASCYPVVFFGKSFMTYGPYVSSLYPFPPYLPGCHTGNTTSSFFSSDLGAASWSIFPNTVVQYDAVTKFFEFPFWTRYTSRGHACGFFK